MPIWQTGPIINGGIYGPNDPIISDAGTTPVGTGGASMTSPSREKVSNMAIERRIVVNRKIGASVTTYDAELLSILSGEFI